MSDESQTTDILHARIAELEKENIYLAAEAEQALHSRIIAEKLALSKNELDMINILVESVVTYNSLFYAAYYRCSNTPGELLLESSYCLNSEIEKPSSSMTLDENLFDHLQSLDGYFDLMSETNFDRNAIPDGADFYDAYLVPVYLHENMRGLLFVANTDTEATEYQNHLNAVLTPTLLMEHQLAQHIHLQELEKEVENRTNELVRDVQQRIEVEQQLAEKDKKLHELLELSTDLIWEIDLDGCLVSVDEKVESIFGYASNELLNSPLQNIIRPDMQAGFSQLYGNCKNTHSDIKDVGFWYECKNRAQVYMEISAFPVFDENNQLKRYRGVARDATEKKRVEESLLESQQKLALHFEQTPLGVIEWDLKFQVVAWNPAAEKIFGFSEPETIGRHVTELILPPHYRTAVDEIWFSLLQNKGGERSTNQNTTKDGRTITCEWYNTPLVDINGDVVGVASLVQDVTERIKQESEIINAKVTADDANRAKSDFLSNMSHELRTPMHGVLSYAEFGLLKTGKVPEEKIMGYFSQIKNSGLRLLSLLNDLLDLSKLEAGKMEMEFKLNDLHQIVTSCVAEQQARLSEMNISIVEEGLELLPGVECDKVRIGQVMTNLLSNAIKFAPENSQITFIYSLDEICDEQKKCYKAVRVGISDMGPGLPEEEMDSIFNKFIQSRINRDKGGTGLGLAISKEIIDAHKGRIWGDNNLNGGALFQFALRVSVTP